jgi:hypothetical protein
VLGFRNPNLEALQILYFIVATDILKKRDTRMNEIPGEWSLSALLLFGGAFTALAVGIAIFLAESWFQEIRQRREHLKISQNQQLKIWRDMQRESFLRLSSDQGKKAQSEVTRGPMWFYACQKHRTLMPTARQNKMNPPDRHAAHCRHSPPDS